MAQIVKAYRKMVPHENNKCELFSRLYQYTVLNLNSYSDPVDISSHRKKLIWREESLSTVKWDKGEIPHN